MKEKACIIEQLLNDKAIEVFQASEVPHDFASIKKAVLQNELKQEMVALKTMLLDCDTFEMQFKARCFKRETDKEFAISCHDMPQSPSNSLYWEIALLVFEPNTMKEMLNIIAPSIRHQLKVDIDYFSHNTALHGIQVMKPEVTLEQVNHLDALEKDKPILELFTHYVLSKACLFDIKNIAQFGLMQHGALQNQLTQSYPEFSTLLYQHNSTLQTLSKDIQIFNKGITPKTAIEQLIQALVSGGEQMTGKPYASDAATAAAESFSQFFNALPIKTQETLRELKGDGVSLGEIIDKEMTKGQCVETISLNLNSILKHNKNQQILILPSAIGQRTLKELKDKYGPKHSIIIQKEDLLVPYFPKHIINEVIEHITPSTLEELISLIIHFPPSFYDTLWQHLHFDEPKGVLDHLAYLISVDYFEISQKQALARALTKKYPIKATLFCAVKTGDLDFLHRVLEGYPKKEWFIVVKETDSNDISLLQYAVWFPDFIKTLLHFLPEKERLKRLLITNSKGYSAFDYAIRLPESLKVLLQLLSKEDLRAVVQHNNNALLYSAARYPKSLEILLSVYSAEEQLTLIQKSDKDGKIMLHHVAKYPDSLQAILNRYSEEERLDVVQIPDKNGKTPLYYAHESPQSLLILLSLYPIDERFAVVVAQNLLFSAVYSHESIRMILSLLLEKDWGKVLLIKERRERETDRMDGKTFLYNALTRIETLTVLQEIIPAKYWLAALQQGAEEGNSALHEAVYSSECLLKVIRFLPEQALIAAVQTKNKEGKTILHCTAAYKPELCCQILLCLPEAYRFAAIQIQDKYNNAVVMYVKNSFDAMKLLLSVLPEEDKLQALQVFDCYNTLMHLPIGEIERASANEKEHLLLHSIKQKLSLLPESCHLQALQTEDKHGKPPLYALYREPSLLKEILNLLPTSKRLALLQTQYNGSSILGELVGKPELLRIVLSELPQHDWLSALQTVIDCYGLRVLYLISSQPKCLELLLNTLPNEISKKAIAIKGHQGSTLLHNIASKSESLQLLLPFYSKEVLPHALQVKDNEGCMPLHYADAKSLEMMLSYYSEKEQFELINREDNQGATVLFHIHSPELVKVIFTRYPEEERLKIAQTKNKEGKTLLSYFRKKLPIVGAILHWLSEEDRFTALQTKDSEGLTLLETLITHHNFPKEFLAEVPDDTNFALYCMAMKVICRFSANRNENPNSFFSNSDCQNQLSSLLYTSSEMVKKNLTCILREDHNNPTKLQMKLVKKLGQFESVTKEDYEVKLDDLLQGWNGAVNPRII